MLQIVASITDDFGGIIYNRNVFIVQATEDRWKSDDCANLLFEDERSGVMTFGLNDIFSIHRITCTFFTGRMLL